MEALKQTAVKSADMRKDLRCVYISYASEDEDAARLLCEKLEAAGISVWYADRDIKPGEFIPGEIAKAIEQCSVFIILLSKFSAESESLKDELTYSLRMIRDGHAINLGIPLAIDREGREVMLDPGFRRWKYAFDASKPPLNARFEEFAQWMKNSDFTPLMRALDKLKSASTELEKLRAIKVIASLIE